MYSLISAVGIFFLGAGVSVYHGVATLMAAHTLQSLPLVRCVRTVCVCVALAVIACVSTVHVTKSVMVYHEIPRSNPQNVFGKSADRLQ